MFSLGNLRDLLLGRLDEGLDLRVSRAAPPGGAPTSWEARIYRLADGRAISEIAATLFAEEARAGAWAVDIGVWHDSSVAPSPASLTSWSTTDGFSTKLAGKDCPDCLWRKRRRHMFSGVPGGLSHV